MKDLVSHFSAIHLIFLIFTFWIFIFLCGRGRTCTYEDQWSLDFTYHLVSQMRGLYHHPLRAPRYLVSTALSY